MRRLLKAIAGGGLGLAIGAGIGALLALLDLARGPLGLRETFSVGKLDWAVLWYAGLGGLAGIVLGLILGLAGRRFRALGPVLLLGSLLLFVAALLNMLVLPAHTSPSSLAVDLLLLLGTGWAVRAWWKRDWKGSTVVTGLALVAAAWPVLLAAPRLVPEASEERVNAPLERSSRHPSVLLVVVDTVRADHTSLHGYERATTPNLEAFARDALDYRRAYAPSSWTKSSCASLLTGLPPGVHGAEGGLSRLPDQAVTLPELFRAADYRTALFTDNPIVSSTFGFTQGFDRVMERVSKDRWDRMLLPFGGVERLAIPAHSLLGIVGTELVVKRTDWLSSSTGPEAGAPRLNQAFFDWIDGFEDEERWFAYLHFMEPHTKYSAPPPWNEKFGEGTGVVEPPRFLGAGLGPFVPGKALPEPDRLSIVRAYDQEIAWWDHCFGELMAELDRRFAREEVVVVVTSDHGESFYEHRLWIHRNSLYEPQIHVPLLIRSEGVEPGRCDPRASLLGLADALLSLAGFTPPRSVSDHAPPLLPAPTEDQLVRTSLDSNGLWQHSFIEDGKKWILSRYEDREQLEQYDLANDPGETRDLLSAEDSEAAEAMRTRIRRRAELEKRLALRSESEADSEEAARMLRGLGYAK